MLAPGIADHLSGGQLQFGQFLNSGTTVPPKNLTERRSRVRVEMLEPERVAYLSIAPQPGTPPGCDTAGTPWGPWV